MNTPADPDPAAFVADRLAISDLVHAYAQGVDRRDPDAVAGLFTEDGIFSAYATPGAAEPTSRSQGEPRSPRRSPRRGTTGRPPTPSGATWPL